MKTVRNIQEPTQLKPSVRQIMPFNAAGLKEFIELERKLVGTNALFVSEIDSDVKKYLSGRSAFYDAMEHTMFVASNGVGDVARCAAFINRRYQQSHGEEPVGFIGYFAAGPHAEREVREMLSRAEEWLAQRGITRVLAPVDGAGLIDFGLRTAAFDEAPMFPYHWNPPYYMAYLEEAGYRPSYPVLYYEIDFSSEKYREASQRGIEKARCVVRPINKKRWDEEIETVLYLWNESYGPKEWEFQRFTLPEFREFWDQIKAITDPQQYLIAEVDGEPVGNCLGMPDWNPLFRSFRGRMGPIQVVRLMLSYKRYRRAGLLNIIVVPGHRGEGIARTLAATLYRYYEKRGLPGALYYPVNDANSASRRLAESFGGCRRALYHGYDKLLT